MRLPNKVAYLAAIFGAILSVSAFAYKEDTHELLSDAALRRADSVPYAMLPVKVEKLLVEIRRGARNEDSGNRPFRHFYRPEPESGLYVGAQSLAYAHSPAWILDGTDQTVGQVHSYGSALKQYKDVFAATTSTQRESATLNLFQDLGHVIHHIQDMAQPQHVRLDDHCDTRKCLILYKPSAYEEYSNAVRAEFASMSSTAPYTRTNRSIAFREAKDFWKNTGGTGIAQYTFRNFVSINTNFLSCATSAKGYCSRSTFPSPAAESTRGEPFPGQPFVEYVLTGPYPDHSTNRDRPVSAVSLLPSYKSSASFLQAPFTLNSVNYRYTNLALVPKAIGYSSGLINFFFRADFDAEVDPNGLVLIQNKGAELPAGKFQLYYDSGGLRVLASSFTYNSAGIAEGVKVSTNLRVPSVLADSPGRFVLVYEGNETAGRGVVGGRNVTLVRTVDTLVNSRGTYLRVDTGLGYAYTNPETGEVTPNPDAQIAPTRIALADLNAKPGDIMLFKQLGGMSWATCPGGGDCVPLPDTAQYMFARFITSNGATTSFIPPPSGPYAAVSQGITQPTCNQSLPTDILGDFVIAPTDYSASVVPPNAVALEFSADDCYFSDNGDPNGDYVVRIGVLSSNP